MRKCLAIIFIIIFTFQVIPVKVLGKLMAKGQTEEEVKSDDCGDDADDCKIGKYNDFLSDASLRFTSACTVAESMGFIVHKSDDLPVSYVAEILSPPPNC